MSDKTIRLLIDFTYNQDIMHGDDEEAIKWFNDDILLGDNLHLGDFGDIGDIIGSVKVVPHAADRIKKLQAENKRLKALVAGVIHSMGDDPEIMAASRAEWAARALTAEAKLAKAVEALSRIEDASKFYALERVTPDNGTLRYAHETTRRLCATTLAELTKERSDKKGEANE
jgi:hypothetical protein